MCFCLARHGPGITEPVHRGFPLGRLEFWFRPKSIAGVKEYSESERREMVARVGRMVAREWARKKPYYLLSTSPAPVNRTFRSASPGSASFCTDAAVISSRVKIFDRDLKRKQRDRAAWLMGGRNEFVDSVAENLLDRLEDCKKTFSTALCLGGSSEAIRRLIRGRGGIEKLIMMDMSLDMIKHLKDTDQIHIEKNLETLYVVGDEEFLPIKENSIELVVSCLGLHWTNDLPGAMIQCRLALKPDGLFLGAILGGDTLKELRMACTISQLEREGGISPRMSPLAQVRDAGNLLTRAGFALPGVDVDEYTVRYDSALELIEHLRTMAETNALLQRSNILKRDTALATAAVYESMFAAEDGKIPATFQVIYMTGWKEHPSQQKAKSRGSATISFEDIQKHFDS